MLEGGIDLRQAALLLHLHHLHPVLHDRHRVLDVVLDRLQSGELKFKVKIGTRIILLKTGLKLFKYAPSRPSRKTFLLQAKSR